MKERTQKHIVDILFVVALFGLFVLSAIALISIGARVYSRTMSNMDDNFTSRTAIAYITEKIHQSDSDNAVKYCSFAGNPAFSIDSTVGDIDYKTYIYEYEDVLRELTTRADLELSPSAGQKIIEVDEFNLVPVNEKLIHCIITMMDGQHYDFYVSTHSGRYEDEL